MKVKKECITSGQKKAMLEFMNEHPNLREGKFSPNFTTAVARKLWEQCTEVLNNISGPNKTWHEWRKSWQDIRKTLRIKTKRVGVNPSGTGSGSLKAEQLSTMEDKKFSSISEIPVCENTFTPKSKGVYIICTPPTSSDVNGCYNNNSSFKYDTPSKSNLLTLHPPSSMTISTNPVITSLSNTQPAKGLFSVLLQSENVSKLPKTDGVQNGCFNNNESFNYNTPSTSNLQSLCSLSPMPLSTEPAMTSLSNTQPAKESFIELFHSESVTKLPKTDGIQNGCYSNNGSFNCNTPSINNLSSLGPISPVPSSSKPFMAVLSNNKPAKRSFPEPLQSECVTKKPKTNGIQNIAETLIEELPESLIDVNTSMELAEKHPNILNDTLEKYYNFKMDYLKKVIDLKERSVIAKEKSAKALLLLAGILTTE